MLQQVIQDLRALCTELRPPTLAPFGLEKAIRSHAGSFQATHPQLNIQLDLASDGQTLSEQVRLALFRIYQEGLNNVVRHAEASHLQIRFSLDEKQSVLEIEDDGRGFKLPPRPIQLARQGHLGLIGAIERAEAVGGQLKITSAPEKGTLIRIVVPRQ
jgi:signal transduction histidine kinase